MADTYTLQLGFQQPQVNADAGVWGGYLNTDLQAIDDAIAGFVVINLTGLTSYTLTAVQGSEGVNYQQRYQVWVFTGALTGTCTVNIGAKQKVGYVYNQTTGGNSVILTTGGGGATVTLPPAFSFNFLFCDGVNVSLPLMGNFLPISGGTITGNLTVTGQTVTDGVTFFGTSAQFYAQPNNSGNQLLNFAANNYLEFVPGSGFFLTTGGVFNINAPSGMNVSANFDVAGNTFVGGSLQADGVTYFGTSAQFYANPNSGGSQLLNFAAGNYIGYNSGFPGILIQSTADISIKPATGFGVFINSTVAPSVDGISNLGGPSARWAVVYAVVGTIQTSDANEKQDITDLPAALLDAWDTMHVRAFRFRSAATEKGDAARRHTGYIAQEFAAALSQQKLVPAEWGSWCKDILEQGSERQGLRHDELFAIADAAHRRRMDRLMIRLDAIEAAMGKAT